MTSVSSVTSTQPRKWSGVLHPPGGRDHTQCELCGSREKVKEIDFELCVFVCSCCHEDVKATVSQVLGHLNGRKQMLMERSAKAIETWFVRNHMPFYRNGAWKLTLMSTEDFRDQECIIKVIPVSDLLMLNPE